MICLNATSFNGDISVLDVSKVTDTAGIGNVRRSCFTSPDEFLVWHGSGPVVNLIGLSAGVYLLQSDGGKIFRVVKQ